MNETKPNVFMHLSILLTVTIIIKCIATCVFQLHYNEAYYISYAQYPELSQFDHPPVVGFMILASTWFLKYTSEFFVRLGPIIFGTGSIYLVYLITKKLTNERAGIIAAYLSAANIYILLYCGLFVLPDDALTFFSLLSLNFFVNYIFDSPDKAKGRDIFFSFLFFGLAIYSKYTGIYLGLGIFLYIIFFNRKYFGKLSMYFGSLLPFFFIGLIILWNYNNNFTTYNFHSNRVDLFPTEINFGFFFRQLSAQFGITNPLVFLLILLSVVCYFKKKFMTKKYFWMMIFCSLPLILTVLYLSFDEGTNEHWAGLSYAYLIVIAAAFLDSKLKTLKLPMIISYLTIGIMIYPIGIIGWNWYQPNLTKKIYPDTEFGKRDWRLNFYGWKQVGDVYDNFVNKNPQYKTYPLVSYNFRNTSELNYYVAPRTDNKVITLGTLWDTHKYFWVNEKLGELKPHSNALYVAASYKYFAPNDTKQYIGAYFKKVTLLHKQPIYLHGKVVEYAFIYLMEDFTTGKDSGKLEYSL
jgi:hypothetical protein